MQTIHSPIRFLVLTACCAAWSLTATATETGGNSYPLGVETTYAGVMPPDGAHVFIYLPHYEASHSKDDAGNDNARLARFKLRSNAVGTRLSYVWPGARFLGARIETRAVVAYTDVRLTASARTPAGLADVGGHSGAIADVLFAPVLLGWDDGDFHQMSGLDLMLPTGKYDSKAPVSIGRNYWQAAPFYSATWLPGRWQLSAKLRYGINGRNSDTDYKSGREATLEYSAGYGVLPGVVVGLNGYVYRQTTDDVKGGAAVNGNGNRGRVSAFGPYAGYQFSKSASIQAKLLPEYGARNRPEGTRAWVQVKVGF